MKNSKMSLTKDFKHYIFHHTDLSVSDREYVHRIFSQSHIKKTVRISLILLTWTFFATFFDSALFSGAIVASAVTGIHAIHFLPNFLFLMVNLAAKLLFISWFDSEKILNTKERILASLPSIGIILFLGSVFKKEKIFLKALRGYLGYVRKRGIKSILSLLNIKNIS